MNFDWFYQTIVHKYNVVAICSQMHISIDSNTKLKRPKDKKIRRYNYLK